MSFCGILISSSEISNRYQHLQSLAHLTKSAGYKDTAKQHVSSNKQWVNREVLGMAHLLWHYDIYILQILNHKFSKLLKTSVHEVDINPPYKYMESRINCTSLYFNGKDVQCVTTNYYESHAHNTYPILSLRITVGRATWPASVIIIGLKTAARSIAPGLASFTCFCPLVTLTLTTLIP